MKLRRSLLLLFVLLALFPVARIIAQTKAHHVVFAVTSEDEADWNLAMGNIRNLIGGLPTGSVEVEVVAFGPGIALVHKGSSEEQAIQSLEALQVRFVACENSMRKRNLTKADLVQGVGTVPAGIIEVVTKQEQGWSYIKAGR